jgi:hypothetical protein
MLVVRRHARGRQHPLLRYSFCRCRFCWYLLLGERCSRRDNLLVKLCDCSALLRLMLCLYKEKIIIKTAYSFVAQSRRTRCSHTTSYPTKRCLAVIQPFRFAKLSSGLFYVSLRALAVHLHSPSSVGSAVVYFTVRYSSADAYNFVRVLTTLLVLSTPNWAYCHWLCLCCWSFWLTFCTWSQSKFCSQGSH